MLQLYDPVAYQAQKRKEMDQKMLQKWAENQVILPFDQKIVTTEFPKKPKPEGTAIYSADKEDGNLL